MAVGGSVSARRTLPLLLPSWLLLIALLPRPSYKVPPKDFSVVTEESRKGQGTSRLNKATDKLCWELPGCF